MTIMRVNPNFHILAGRNMLDNPDPRFRDYRRKWEDWPKNFMVGSFPLHLDIEITGLCNLRCPFCATSYEPITDKGFTSLDSFKRIIDEGAEHGLCAIKLNSGGRSEPLLNRSLPEMVEYAKRKGIMDVYFNTNATLLTRDVGRKLIKAGLDRFSISFEGTTAEVYEKYRVGASFKRVLKNIKEFMALRKEMNATHPLVRVQTVALPELVPTLDEYARFWGNIVDEVASIDFKDYSRLKHDLVYDWACPYLWQRMMIRWEGSISICQFDYSSTYNLGNINSGGKIRSAWEGRTMEQIRDLHKKGRSHEVKLCNGCPFRTTEILKLMDGE